MTATNGLAAPGAAVVQRARDELLAGAAFALQQHGRVAGRDGVDAIEQAQHLHGTPDDDLADAFLRQLRARDVQLRSNARCSAMRFTRSVISSISNGLVR